MILFLVVVLIFFALYKISVPKDLPDDGTLKFVIPRHIIQNHRVGMSLLERERRRRRLIDQVFQAGFYSREQLETKQEEDKKLSNTPYTYLK